MFEIFKRSEPKKSQEPKFEDNWKAEQYEKNVRLGVASLQKGRAVKIYDDGRGFELALEIKREYILQRSRQLAEKIKIKGSREITISMEI
jgi:hypothetical protein